MRNSICLFLCVCLTIFMQFLFLNEPVDAAGYYYGTGLGVSPADPRPHWGHTPRPPIVTSTDKYLYTVYDYVIYRKPFRQNSKWETTPMRLDTRGPINMKSRKITSSNEGPFMYHSSPTTSWTVTIEMRNGSRWKFVEGEYKCSRMQ